MDKFWGKVLATRRLRLLRPPPSGVKKLLGEIGLQLRRCGLIDNSSATFFSAESEPPPTLGRCRLREDVDVGAPRVSSASARSARMFK